MKKLIVIVLMVIAFGVNAQDKPKFNDAELTLTEQTEFPNANLYKDEKRKSIYKYNFKIN
jgi:hypothetical protein